jgi:fibronectin type 3 domain-containing protein
VTFTPQSSGAASASASYASNASNSTAIEALTGSGAAKQHSAGLSWNASPSVVAGYNVYRGNNSGGPYSKINATLDATTSYADNSVQPGQAYYYVATAVDASGKESAYSIEAPAVIPIP